MAAIDNGSPNQAAYRRLQPLIDQTYPQGQFVAIEQESIVADASSFEELNTALHAVGKHSKDILVVQAGVHYPEYVDILAAGTQI